MRRFVVRAARLAAVILAFTAAAAAQSVPSITLAFDCRDIGRNVLHVRETVPVRGSLTLVLPKWIPGEHGPNGSIAELVNLRMRAGGRPVAYRRDDIDMFAFHVNVPSGASQLEVTFDHLYAPQGDSTTPNLAIVNWVDGVLYPQGARAADVRVSPSITLPEGWQFGTALAPVSTAGATTAFAPVSLETLVDSPVDAGRYVRNIPLYDKGGTLNEAVIVADSPASYELKETTVADMKNLVTQADALFGARHWRNYHFLITLSDTIAHFGLEHHESSDDRINANSLTDENAVQSDLLPHEYVHSWNGKYRRPAGLAMPDYQTPMRDELLWVYEGLTQYYGQILAFRSGFRKSEDYPEFIAQLAASLDAIPGRATRPLVDTAIAIPFARRSSGTYNGLRRGGDYYPEGAMVWLEADQIIRSQSGGSKSLDDFARAFYGGAADTGPAVVSYTRADVVSALNAVQAYDWKAFFDTRVDAVQPRLASDGIEKGGWRLVFNDTPNKYIRLRESSGRFAGVDERYALGAQFTANGRIIDVYPATPAARAGLAPGMRVLAVNGLAYTGARLHDAVKAAKGTNAAIALIAENAGFVTVTAIDYHGGERYPHLERIGDRADMLAASVQPKPAVR
ncbi:MAG: M61 family metallopeptidase [Candidatus Velthaea sp.]